MCVLYKNICMLLVMDGILTPRAVAPWTLEQYPPGLILVQTCHGRMPFVAVAREASAPNGVLLGSSNFLCMQLRWAATSWRNQHMLLPSESRSTQQNSRLDLYRDICSPVIFVPFNTYIHGFVWFRRPGTKPPLNF